MSDSRDPRLEQWAERYRATARPDGRHRERLRDAIRSSPPPTREPALRGLTIRPRAITIGWPLAAAATAVVLAGGIAIGVRLAPRSEPAPAAMRPDAVARLVRFELDAPFASRVALVGDFNGWDPAATPMRLDAGRGRWTTALALQHGRHVYAFVIDGDRWLPDPDAPLAPESGFGTPGSVVVVEGAEPS